MAKRFIGSRIDPPICWVTNIDYRFYSHHLKDFYNCDTLMTPIVNRKS